MDRLSDLPEAVRIHILSLLTTKEAVRSCILSKIWKNAWASVPVLKINVNEWLDGTVIGNYEKIKECQDKLMQFVNGVLENRGQSNLDRFQFVSSIDDNPVEVSLEWLDRVVHFKPLVMDISVDGHNAFDVPDSVFSCTSLEELSLDILSTNLTTVVTPRLINLPSLKILELYGVDLEDNFTRKLFVGCPILESLVLGSCILGFSDISSNELKKLVLRGCWHDKQMQISCPSLDSLVIESDAMGGISLNNMISLVSAEFEFDLHMFDANSTLNLLSQISNISRLSLNLRCKDFKEILEDDITNCKSFNNLRSLEISHWDVNYGLYLVACFLKDSPCLQILTLHLKELRAVGSEEEPSGMELGEVDFQREHLETIRITKSGTDAVLVYQLIKNLRAHVKTIGNIIFS